MHAVIRDGAFCPARRLSPRGNQKRHGFLASESVFFSRKQAGSDATSQIQQTHQQADGGRHEKDDAAAEGPFENPPMWRRTMLKHDQERQKPSFGYYVEYWK